MTRAYVTLSVILIYMMPGLGIATADQALPQAIRPQPFPESPAGFPAPGGAMLHEVWPPDWTRDVRPTLQWLEPGQVVRASAVSPQAPVTAFRWWTEGQSHLVPAIQNDETFSAELQLPQVHGRLDRQPVTLIWPLLDEKAGLAVRLRAPQIWRVHPAVLQTSSTGVFRILGDNVAVPGGKPLVVLKKDGQAPRALEITHRSSTSLQVRLPADLAPGRHLLQIHNGTGGWAGWSEPLALDVQPAEESTDGEAESPAAHQPAYTHATWLPIGAQDVPKAQALEDPVSQLPRRQLGPLHPDIPFSNESPASSLVPDDKQTPALGAATETTFPGETLVASGANLLGATLKVWVEGRVIDLEPLRTADDRLQAVLPKVMKVDGECVPLPRATMLVWPVRDKVVGAPIRINAPQIWWHWPARMRAHASDQRLRLFGRNLTLRENSPRVMLSRQASDDSEELIELEIVKAEPYHLEVQLPDGLAPGRYRVWTHNGTGGAVGFSEPTSLDLVEAPKANETEFPVAVRPGETDLTTAMQAAIRQAAEAGGGIVTCPPGRYEVHRKLVLPKNVPIVIRGAGMGEWDRDSDAPKAGGTVLVGPGGDDETYLIAMEGAGSRLEDLTLIHKGSAKLGVVGMAGRDQTLQRVRIVRDPVKHRYLPNVRCRYTGSSQQQIIDCELFFGFQAVRIENGNDYVRIAGSLLRGRFDGGVLGARADAVENRGGANMILEDCDITSEDRGGGRLVSRTCLLYKSGIRHCYLANNRSVDVGAHSSVDGMGDNFSEQYLFHDNGPGGGVFNSKAATADTVVLDDIGDLAERKLDNGQWIIFVAAGRGAGQFREIREREGETLHLARPWRIIPGAGARVIVEPVFRQNLVYQNHIEPSASAEHADPSKKTAGVYWYKLAFDNITAGNTIRNAGSGIAITTSPTKPAAWNLVRDNHIEFMAGKSAGTSVTPMFYNENIHAWEAEWRESMRHWSGVGNVFRSNTCRGSDAAVLVGWFQFSLDAPDYVAAADRGLVMSVIENNSFSDVDRGMLLAAPGNWTLFRANRTQGKDDEHPAPIEMHAPHQLYAPMSVP